MVLGSADWNENWNCEVEERRAFVQLRVAR